MLSLPEQVEESSEERDFSINELDGFLQPLQRAHNQIMSQYVFLGLLQTNLEIAGQTVFVHPAVVGLKKLMKQIPIGFQSILLTQKTLASLPIYYPSKH